MRACRVLVWHENQPINFEDYVEQGQHKLAKQLLNATTLQQDTDRLVTAAKEANIDFVELADRMRQKYGLKGSTQAWAIYGDGGKGGGTDHTGEVETPNHDGAHIGTLLGDMAA